MSLFRCSVCYSIRIKCSVRFSFFSFCPLRFCHTSTDENKHTVFSRIQRRKESIGYGKRGDRNSVQRKFDAVYHRDIRIKHLQRMFTFLKPLSKLSSVICRGDKNSLLNQMQFLLNTDTSFSVLLASCSSIGNRWRQASDRNLWILSSCRCHANHFSCQIVRLL